MSYTIVYKTFGQDLKWLKYSLLSVNKYVEGVDEILIYYHNECHNDFIKLMDSITLKIPYRTIQVGYDYHGYLKQMVTKLMCFKDVKTDHVVFVDSDAIFNRKYNPKYQMDDDKVIWYILKKDSSNSHMDDWRVWGKSVENMTHQPMKYYYMANWFPFVLKTTTLVYAYDKFVEIHHKNYDEFCKEQLEKNHIYVGTSITANFQVMSTIFEEFEYLGWFARNYTNDYIFIENTPNRDPYVTQFWSHGGITQDIEKQILNILQI